MKIVNNALSDSLLLKLLQETENKKQLPCWTPSDFFKWNAAQIQKGFAGTFLQTLLNNKDLQKELEVELRPHLPTFRALTVYHQIWLKNSGIYHHDDGHVDFGVTVYLTEEWDMSDGGIFMWEDRDSKEFKTLCPTFNTVVVNDRRETHMVTPVSPLTQKLRSTLQIWGTI